MNRFYLTILISFTTICVAAQNNPDAILGKWITDANNCIVEVYKQNAEYKAKVVWFDIKGKQPMNDWMDVKNPDKSLRSRKLLGLEVLNRLHYNHEANEWVGGVIYDATTGKKWDSVVWLTQGNSLKVKGYWLFRWICETKTFKRVDGYSVK